MKIIFIQTGGTIDKDYPKIKGGYAFEFGEPATKRILKKLNPSFDFEVLTAFQKDSLDITTNDLENLSNLIKDLKTDKIIITHGTDTMLETASYLNHHLKDKAVIITGAMRPERFSNSDAPINLGCAIGAINVLEHGIFIAMHGIVNPYFKMKRNSKSGKYY